MVDVGAVTPQSQLTRGEIGAVRPHGQTSPGGHLHNARVPWLVAGVVVAMAVAVQLSRRTVPPTRPDGRVVVRCREGHLFTTVWVPFMSFKAIRLGAWRWQRCPVADHWTFVAAVPDDQLTDSERHIAEQFHDGPIP